MNEGDVLFCATPKNMLSVTYAALPFKYVALGQGSPKTLIV
jgi:hypothetical protein